VIEPLSGGWTNRNFAVRTRSGEFVLRVSGANLERLGIDRRREHAAARIAEAAGVGARIICFLEPEGHMVTERVRGRALPWEGGRSDDEVRGLARATRAIHEFEPASEAAYSGFERVRSYVRDIAAAGRALPQEIDAWLGELDAHAAERRDHARTCMTHNDLSPGNFVIGEAWRVLDWEYAALGDPLFDLATLCVAHDLTPDQEELLLATYGAEPEIRGPLGRMKRVYALREATWAALQLAYTDPEPELRDEFERAEREFFDRLR